jgi:histidine triad (HIT) family protein
MRKDDCIFCRIIDRKIPSKIVFEDETVLAIDDINPQAPVHVVVIPKVHVEKLSDVNDENAEAVCKMVLAAKEIAEKRGIQESGYRIVINCNKDGGQAVWHLHLHLFGGRPMHWPPG